MGFIFTIIAFLIVLTIHEFSHAWMANRLGDPTAKYAGRVTLNPMAHLDLMGTLLLIFIGLGWGKPVPVDPRNFEKPIRDSAIVAAAGPASNIVLAFATAIPYKYLMTSGSENLALLGGFFGAVFQLSLVLFIFNFLPFPPLDGSKVVGYFMPMKYQRQYQEFLYNGPKYFMIFMIVDMFLIEEILGASIVWSVISYLYAIISTAILSIT
ncbi:MAG: Zn-dependent protease [Candidatus Peregrinibacteria bacterium GW2011_GWF2_43_17]|nr:MAG: Zn-dependent protease [Candidatus Peregrinibacteria bacterium GW2011_GWF2_43_17]KKT18674.1 MAG: Zn-dependent protease [Candidatus Peregrinibacteria bacterium GW2011_GWA2_43_8]HAU39573.1 site-2 protease family protein [Candidatus Peregrinibacteria bacterium]